MNIHDIFPALENKKTKEVNLNTEAYLYLLNFGIIDGSGTWLKDNPLVNPDDCIRFIEWLHKKYEIDYSYGGYGEDRSTLWHNTYLDSLGTFYHLGIDINIPDGTVLCSPLSGEIIVSDHDRDHPDAPQNHGWGNRLIIRSANSENDLIFAHLSNNTKKEVGSIITKGEILGTLGKSNENGGWFSHFHIQCIKRTALDSLLGQGRLSELDGYAVSMDGETRYTYPNPFNS